MRGLLLTEVENYLEEIIEALDFSSLNHFLYEHMRTEFTFEQLVAQISTEGLSALNAENVCRMVFDSLFYEFSIARAMFLKMLMFSLLFSILQRFLISGHKYISDSIFFFIYAALMVLLMQSFLLVKEIALQGMDALLTFLNALIPTYAITLTFTGNAISGAMLYELAFLFVYFVEWLIKNVLSTLIQVFILVLFLNHLFEEEKLSKLAEFMEKLVQLVLKTAFGAVIGLSMVQSLLTPVKDKLTGNVVLSGLSSIPGIGNALGSAGELILSCGVLIKNSVGIIGIIILFFLAIIPVLKIGVFWVFYHLLSILLEPIADKRIIECVSGISRGCDLYLKMILYSMMLFFVLFSMVSVATSIIR